MWKLTPGTKLAPPSFRVCSAQETEQRLRAVLPRVPVTRISDLTPLDPLGLPAFTAVTPLARDLTTHMGKGVDAVSARVSALMEAVERVSAETAPPGSTRRATLAELAAAHARSPARDARPVDPRQLQLPGDSAFSPERPFTWIQAHDLSTDEPAWMAADLAVSPPNEGILREVDTSGLASGNTHLEATVHALCEVIERDALSQHEVFDLFGEAGDVGPRIERLALSGLPESAAAWARRVRDAGHDLIVQDLTSEVGIATFRALLLDHGYPGEKEPREAVFSGLGTAPDAELALVRSITEAVQSRLGVIQGARDSYNTAAPSARAWTRGARLRWLAAPETRAFRDVPSFRSADLSADLAHLLARVAAAGLGPVLAMDLTRADLGIPVVRVRVPGLSCFVVNRRRVDLRCLRHLV